MQRPVFVRKKNSINIEIGLAYLKFLMLYHKIEKNIFFLVKGIENNLLANYSTKCGVHQI